MLCVGELGVEETKSKAGGNILGMGHNSLLLVENGLLVISWDAPANPID